MDHMELELSLSPPVQYSSSSGLPKQKPFFTKQTTRFPLVSWNGYPHEEEDDDHNKRNSINHYQLDDDHKGNLIGWPPLNSWRKKLIEEQYQYQGDVFNGNNVMNFMDDQRRENENENRVHQINNSNSSNNDDSIFVKVKMDGVGITRKIDLSIFHSYQMLTTSLNHMFEKYHENDEDGTSYNLMYQDRDGEWLLGGVFPWQTFVGRAQRIHLVRN